MKELQPINQNVLIDITDTKTEQKTASGIIIPDSVKEKKNYGKVIGISKIENAEISIGDTVLYKEYSGNEIAMDDKKYLLVPYEEILAKIVETEAI